MAVLTGCKLTLPKVAKPGGLGVSPAWPPAPAFAGRKRGGARGAAFTLALATGGRTGARVQRPSDRIYGRVHVLPSTVALDLLLTPTTRTVEVWNAARTANTLQSLGAVATDGTSLATGTLPVGFGALQSRTFTLSVSTEGPVNLAGTYTLTFAAEAPTLTVTAQRMVTWSFAPDWHTLVEERLSWLTDVVQVPTGDKQRRRLRTLPRREISYQTLLAGPEEQALALGYLQAWADKAFGLPIWTDVARLGSASAPGDMALVLDRSLAGLDFASGAFAILWSSATSFEVGAIQSVVGSSLNLRGAVQQAWPAGTLVAPLRQASVDLQARIGTVLPGVGRLPITFSFDPLPDPAPRLGASPFPTFQGLPVMTWAFNAAQPRDLSWSLDEDVFDAEVAAPARTLLGAYAVTRHPWRRVLRGRAEIAPFLAFLAGLAGRWSPCWLPSWRADVQLLNAASASDTQISVKDWGFRRWALGEGHDRLAFLDTKKAWVHFRQVTAAAAGVAGEERLTLDSAFGVVRQPGDFALISKLVKVYLDHDQVELSWITSDALEVSLTFVEDPR